MGSVKYQLKHFFTSIFSVSWFCAVQLNSGIRMKTYNLASAQKSLGVGSSSNPQAIIPMTDSVYGDPHDLPKTWDGGSMWWSGWGHINSMRAICAESSVPSEGMLLPLPPVRPLSGTFRMKLTGIWSFGDCLFLIEP